MCGSAPFREFEGRYRFGLGHTEPAPGDRRGPDVVQQLAQKARACCWYARARSAPAPARSTKAVRASSGGASTPATAMSSA